jgi:DNA-directed RNA polymerase specialized sigma24 family protein
VLVELEGLSLPAASESLGVRETTCKSRLRTARRLFNAAVSRAAALRKSEGQ